MTFAASVIASFVALFVVVEPLGVVPVFADRTGPLPRHEQIRTAYRASVVGAAILTTFALFGRPLLNALGIGVDAFQLAGSIVLLLNALEMIRGKPDSCGRCAPAEATRTTGDIAIVPFAIPLLAGPGSMTVTMSLATHEPIAAVLLAIIAVFALTFLVLRGASTVQRLLGPAVLGVILRVLGLVLAAGALQTLVRAAGNLLARTV
jgi:multiple antibiotic resistance protein